ncbi:Uncharacterised protein [Chryseobacterium taihuense]|uniref:Uncharacterized protein n=1 Tax=Chryseobacterium taihuense TaxID=1141221 RepID=A0A4U8WMX4_9FLAO|nr:Uncharacterised protein [Chryseobacterium taihuense]
MIQIEIKGDGKTSPFLFSEKAMYLSFIYLLD